MTDASFEDIRAVSTLLHETIHWWQHVGSSAGFIISLSFPLQTQANYVPLTELLATNKPVKSVKQFSENVLRSGRSDALANRIVNNFYDIDFFRSLLTSPESASLITDNPYFENFGHSYRIGYGNALINLSDNFDPDHKVIPDPTHWEKDYDRLRDAKHLNFYYGSPLHVPSVGIKEIFEGQARFAQLQFLHFGTQGHFDFQDAHELGMFDSLYRKAFDLFLKSSGFEWPKSIDDPIVGLFLFLCDMSINPAAGFPLAIERLDSFIVDATPGLRFLRLCDEIRPNRDYFAGLVKEYSFEEYIELGNAFATSLHLHHPYTVAKSIAEWGDATAQFQTLMSRLDTFEFEPYETMSSVLTSHLISFCQDKFKRPELFCWPGKWLTGERITEQSQQILDRQRALFFDKEDDESIFPRKHSGKSDSTVRKTFELFYSAVVLYEMTAQWIAEPGPFKYNFPWWTAGRNSGRMEVYAKQLFKLTYDISPDELTLL